MTSTTDPAAISALPFFQATEDDFSQDSLPRGAVGHLLGGGHTEGPSNPSSARGSASVPAPSPRAEHEEEFWNDVAALRRTVAERLSTADPALTPAAREQYGQKLISDAIGEHTREQLTVGGEDHVWTVPHQGKLTRAVFDSLFRLGRYQAFIDNPRVQNVHINGYDSVWLELDDGTWARGESVAVSDAQLIEDIQLFSSNAGLEGRPFSATHPDLDMDLLGYVRLAAVAPPISRRPVLVMRIHRHINIRLEDLVGMSMLSQETADFLQAAVRAGCNIVVSGLPGTGKTTLMRALAQAIPVQQQIITIEEDRELHLGQLDRPGGPPPIELQARPGSSESDSKGNTVGAYTTEQALRKALRLNAVWLIVGEVRGPEITAMLYAMQAGAGTFSTVHTREPLEAVHRLAGLGSDRFSEDYMRRQLAHHVDLVVQLERPAVGRWAGRRRVAGITEIIPNPDAPSAVSGNSLYSVQGDDEHASVTDRPTNELLERLMNRGGYVPRRPL